MSARPTLNFRETVRHGDDLPRQVRALEAAVKEFAQQVQQWLETYAPATPRSPVTYAKVVLPGNMPEADFAVYDVYAADALQLVMPAHKQGRLVVVKDGAGNAGTFNITLRRKGNKGTINGVEGDYVVSNNNEFAWFISDGDNMNWRRIVLG